MLREPRVSQALSFVVREEEGAIASVEQFRDPNGTSDASSKLVALEGLQRIPGAIRKEVIRVELAIPQKFECASMHCVGSGLRHHGYEPAAAPAILGRVSVRLDAEFLNSLNGGNRADRRDVRNVVRNGRGNAVDHDVRSGFLTAVHNEAVRGERIGNAGRLTNEEHTRHQRGKRVYVSTV